MKQILSNRSRQVILILTFVIVNGVTVIAQSVTWISSTENNTWNQSAIKLEKKVSTSPDLVVKGNTEIITFKAWGTCFNERGWDALNMLPDKEQEVILNDLFSPEGDLRFTMGRFSMNANDYARDWYSCDEVSGDFELKNILISTGIKQH